MDQIEKYLAQLINDPENDFINFELAYAYEKEKQYAAAVSYYLRCAEYTNNNTLVSECLIRCSFSMNKQGGRDQKELHYIKQAMGASPCSLEPYYIASLYFSWRGNHRDSYLYTCLGINIYENNIQKEKFIKDVGFSMYDLYYQKAFACSNIGKINESIQLYVKILQEFDIQDWNKENILKKIRELPEPNHPIVSYTKQTKDKLKYQFPNCEEINENFSQIYQDIFVLSMNDGKKNGTYFEVGAGYPIKGNNTFLLETQFDWQGISIDMHPDSKDLFDKNRKNECICKDATSIDYIQLFSEYYKSTSIDYLQLDCDPANITYDILQKIPFDIYKFGVITYEHDFYNDHTGSYREKSRSFLKSKGYKLICGNISPLKDKYPFEDWWIHPDLIDENIWKHFERTDDVPINGEKYMLTKKHFLSNNYKNFISIGGWCGAKIALKKLGLFDEASLPFDDVRSSMKGIIDCFENNFENYFPKEIYEDNRSLNCPHFIGEYIGFYHDNHNLLDINVIESFKRKIVRFDKKIKKNNCIFIRTICREKYDDEIKQYKNLQFAIDKKYPNISYIICFIIPNQVNTQYYKHIDNRTFLFTLNDTSLYLFDGIVTDAYKPIFDFIMDTNLFVNIPEPNIIEIIDAPSRLWLVQPEGHPMVNFIKEKAETIKDKTNSIKDLYDFIPCHDQKCNDIYRVKVENIKQVLKKEYNNPQVKGVNTKGYVKNNIEKLEQINGWGWDVKANKADGIYIKKTSNNTLVKCSQSSIPVLGTLVCTTTKWIEKQIQSIDFPVENYIIINNNENFLAEKLDILVSKGNKFIKNFKVYHMPYNLGCAEGWNTIIKSFLFSPYWVIVNDDVSFTPGFLKELHETALENPDAGLIHGNPCNLDYLTKFGSFDMFLIRDRIIKDFGLFDTNFYPAYQEDYDYIFRLRNSSVKIINQLKHKYYHGDTFHYSKSGQNTKKFSNELSNKLINIKYKNYNYFYKKWNSNIENINESNVNDIYKYPFNNPANKLSMSLYDIEFAREKSLQDILPSFEKKEKNTFEIKLTSDITFPRPNVIVIDNFYKNVDEIREYALSQTYQSPENHGAVGYRCESGKKIMDGTKEMFEKLMGGTIPNGSQHGEWGYSTNGCFQWCNARVPIVYHCDSQKYAGIIYLTPNAPPNCGTSFFRHKNYKIRNSSIFSKSDWYKSDLNHKEPHLDKTQWEIVDSVGNVYNRLVIFDAQYIHAVTEYFGEDINNSRLFQLFFFNIN
jgi:hypothetical protein